MSAFGGKADIGSNAPPRLDLRHRLLTSRGITVIVNARRDAFDNRPERTLKYADGYLTDI